MNNLPNTLSARLDLSSKSERLDAQLYNELALERWIMQDNTNDEIETLLNNY